MRPALLSALLLSACAAGKGKAPAPPPARTAATRSDQVIGAPDPNKEFHLEQMSPSMGRSSTFQTKTAYTHDSFYLEQKYQPKDYRTGEYKTSGWWAGKNKFATKDAATSGKYAVPNAGKSYETKASATKDATESGKLAAVRDLPDGNRPYLGKEATKMKTALDPTNLPRVSNEMHELKTIDDVKALLNKN